MCLKYSRRALIERIQWWYWHVRRRTIKVNITFEDTMSEVWIQRDASRSCRFSRVFHQEVNGWTAQSEEGCGWTGLCFFTLNINRNSCAIIQCVSRVYWSHGAWISQRILPTGHSKASSHLHLQSRVYSRSFSQENCPSIERSVIQVHWCRLWGQRDDYDCVIILPLFISLDRKWSPIVAI